ncbi:MAG TPA: hypothetical protein VGP79_15020 [Bryobacteraceae bacterium]|nr:hypothetical protein [Bryobacteraceae bacterium]
MPARARTLSLAAFLYALNVYVCRGLFRAEYLRHMGSIEGAYIGISRYAMEHFPDLSWFAPWYDGVPYQNTYPPLLHWIVALVAKILGWSAAHAHHAVTAGLYSLGPVALFALALIFSKSRVAAFLAGLLYTALSLSAWLIEPIANDLGSFLNPRRLQALVYYGEGPHVSALTLLPIALLALHLAITHRRGRWSGLCFSFAVVSLAAVTLTNWLAAFALAMMVICYLVARTGSADWSWRDLAWLGAISIAAYALASPWIPPSTIAVIQENARTIEGDFRPVYQALPRWLAIMLLGLVWLKVMVRRLGLHFQFAIFFAYLMCVLTLMSAWAKISIVPQPIRYHLEMEMALSLVLAFAAYAIFKRTPKWVAYAAMAALLILLVKPMRQTRRYSRDFLLQAIDIKTTTEWKTAQWLNQNWRGGRVMVPGSTSFWLTAFTDTPELAGGFEQGTTNPIIRIALYGIYTGETAGTHDAEFSILWLKSLGVEAVAVSGPNSGEFYKPFHDPKKFEGVLEAIWRDGDDVFYRVSANGSLAHAVPRASLVARAPYNGVDVDPLRPFVAALESRPAADFRWTASHSATVDANVTPGDVVHVQIAWHRGWHAVVNGARRTIEKDNIGLMAIDPGVTGPCHIELNYDGGREMRIAHWLCGLSVISLVVLSGRGILKKS